MSRSILCLLGLASALMGCDSGVSCDRISFSNQQDVETKLTGLINLFEANPDIFHSGYYYTEQGKIRILHDNNSIVVDPDTMQEGHWSRTADDMRGSGIFGLFRRTGDDRWIAPYCKPNADFEQLRYIIVVPSQDSIDDAQMMGLKVLDQSGHMVLVAPVS